MATDKLQPLVLYDLKLKVVIQVPSFAGNLVFILLYLSIYLSEVS